jgi:hypothetical protein
MKQFEEKINNEIQELTMQSNLDPNNISDWYHTFGELYKHRTHLFIALCKAKINTFRMWVWELDAKKIRCTKSEIHHDWFNVSDEWWMFLICLHIDEWQISYHIDNKYWDKCNFAETEVQATEPFDWHTSDDVLDRLLLI